MIRTIIFDIGNVLADFAWEAYYRSYGFDEDILDRLAEATVRNKDWVEYDRGILTEEEVLARFIENDPGLEAVLRKVLHNYHGIVTRFDYAVPWIRELKQKGYQVLVLSNFSEKAYRECRDALDFLKEVDGGILSYREKVIKPMPEIYKLLIERYELRPEECVFLDDLKENLEGAAAFGIHTILFQNRQQALKELEELGVS